MLTYTLASGTLHKFPRQRPSLCRERERVRKRIKTGKYFDDGVNCVLCRGNEERKKIEIVWRYIYSSASNDGDDDDEEDNFYGINNCAMAITWHTSHNLFLSSCRRR